MTARRRVVFLLHPDFELIDFAGPASVFGAARDPTSQPEYDVEAASRLGGPVSSAECVTLHTQRASQLAPTPIDTLVVPGGFAADAAAQDAAFLSELRALAARSRRVASVCSGALLLAAAGLLNGRRATTHWAATSQLRTQHPDVDVVQDVVWVRDGNVYTSAGATTGIDLALALVEEDFGPHLAGLVARWMVVFARRPGGQAQSSVRASLPQPTTAHLRRALDAAVERPASDLTVQALAALCSMSPRHFARLFAEELGITPARYVERVRVEAAQQHLEASGATLDVIAAASGFSSVETMRRAFHRILGVSPGQYRSSLARSGRDPSDQWTQKSGDGPVSRVETTVTEG